MLAASAVFYSCIWPWRSILGHLAIVALLGALLVDLFLGTTPKIPFTCSYLPGKSNFHLSFWLSIALVFAVVVEFAKYEVVALESPFRFANLIAILSMALLAARWRSTPDSSDISPVEFEEVPSSSVIQLGLSSNL